MTQLSVCWGKRALWLMHLLIGLVWRYLLWTTRLASEMIGPQLAPPVE
jgi:hypothetical protein